MKSVRGYIFSRPFMGERVPQHVQNLVIRDYCEKHHLRYQLSATEYTMQKCHLVLTQVLKELAGIDGIVAYSLFQLPEDDVVRASVVKTVLSRASTIHFAVENLRLGNAEEAERVESIWLVKKTLPQCPRDMVASNSSTDCL